MRFSTNWSIVAISCLLISISLADDYTCTDKIPCKLGCCSKGGVCGFGPTFCAPDKCQSSCDGKSDCDPGWGSQWASREKCPLNVCCSKYGFCGTTKDFCGSETVKAPSCGGTSSNKRTVGYYEGWSMTRSCGGMMPEDIPSGSYTHLNFAFAFIDPSTFQVSPMDSNQVGLYSRTTALKQTTPGLQVWISIGGWSMNDPDQSTHATFSDLAGSKDAQSKFFSSLLSFMQTYGFDGVDIDWEYPVAPERSGNKADFTNYVTFLQNLKRALGSGGHKYGLSITIPSSYWYLQNFDIVNIAKTIDWFNMMTYDLHGTWDSTDKYIGSIINAHTNLTEIDLALDLLWRNDIDPDQVVLGLGFYGRSFTLSDPSCTSAGCPFSSGGNAGPCTDNVGTLSYTEITDIISKGAKVTLDKDAAVKQVTFGGNQWVSYDDKETLGMKIDYANKHCLGGTMVWAVSLDDSNGDAANALSANTGRKERSLDSSSQTFQQSGACFITNCAKSPTCPSGWGAVQQINGKGGDVSVDHGCDKDQKRTFCCPSNDMPTCQWRGSAVACGIKGHCKSGELELTYDTGGCSSGHKVLCCTTSTSDEARDQCVWKGTASLCMRDNACTSEFPKELARSNTGDNQQPCDYDGISNNLKRFCCKDPPPYTNCDWYTKGDQDPPPSPRPGHCSGQCPQGKTLVASDNYCFFGGTRAFCCGAPSTYNDAFTTDYKNKLQSFVNEPTCPVDLPYSITDSMDLGIRGLDTQSFGSMGGIPTLDQTWAAFKNDSAVKIHLTEAWNDIMGEEYGVYDFQATDYVNLDRAWQADDQPPFDPARSIGEYICNEDPDTVLDCRIESEELCLLSPGPSLTEILLKKRKFQEDNTNVVAPPPRPPRRGQPPRPPPPVSNQPRTAAIMQAVIDNTIPLMYITQLAYRPQLLNPGQPYDFVDMELEVVYDIRGHPELQETVETGVHDTNPNTDRFAIFHFHTREIVTRNGQQYPSINSFSVYHGQEVFQNTGIGGGYGGNGSPEDPNLIANPDQGPYNLNNWRVDFRQLPRGRNERQDILNCNRPGTVARYAGGFEPGNPSNRAGGTCNNRIVQFGRVLRDRGILHPDTYTRWTGSEWRPQYGDSPNMGPRGTRPPPANMEDFQDLNHLPPPP